MGRGGRCHPHEFAQSHIGERRLPPAAYKHELTSGVLYPSRVLAFLVHSQSEQYLIGEKFVPLTKRRCLMGTPHLWADAYKLRWEASFPDVGLSKFVRVASASLAHSQSEQYLIGERFVPPTLVILNINILIIILIFFFFLLDLLKFYTLDDYILIFMYVYIYIGF